MKKLSRRYSRLGLTEQDDDAGRLTRRSFLNGAGIAVAGGLVTAAGGSLFAGQEAGASGAPEGPALPWKYTKLDPLEAGKRGYENYLLRGG